MLIRDVVSTWPHARVTHLAIDLKYRFIYRTTSAAVIQAQKMQRKGLCTNSNFPTADDFVYRVVLIVGGSRHGSKAIKISVVPQNAHWDKREWEDDTKEPTV